jgi:hypothetical protein
MPIDEATKRRIMDLYFNEHKSIREIAKITKKSSRDITPVLRNSEYKGKDRWKRCKTAKSRKRGHGS